jgi:spermidine synthase
MLTNQEKFKKTYLLILAFTSGMVIMAVEISASRLIAPYFGTSTFVWTNIIGVIMVALALGYYLGGKIADTYPNPKMLLKICLIASFVLLTIPFFTGPLVDFISKNILVFKSASFFIFGGSLITVSLLFILPIILLGMVSPFIIKLLSQLDPRVGKDAGLVFSISTVGSILGTFLPTLLFIPYLGTRKTIIIFTLILILIVLIGFLKRKWLIIIPVFILPILWAKFPPIKNAEGIVYEDESTYQYFQIEDKDNFRYLKINEGLGVFSILNLQGGVLTNSYFDFYNLLPYLNGNNSKQEILILGLAGGTISTQLHNFFAKNYDLKMTGVEIDKKMIDSAKKYFNLENENLNIYNLDGRNFLDLTSNNYNSIIIDAYSSQLYISFHLATKEFFEGVKKHLKESGVIAINVNATSANSNLLKSITNTMNLVFKNVYLIPISEDSWNYMVLASDNELDFKKIKSLNKIPELDNIVDHAINNNIKITYDNNFAYLTDDKAPIEYLTDWMVLDYLFKK